MSASGVELRLQGRYWEEVEASSNTSVPLLRGGHGSRQNAFKNDFVVDGWWVGLAKAH